MESRGSNNRMLAYKLEGSKTEDAWITSFGQMAGGVTERSSTAITCSVLLKIIIFFVN